jgi:uncharacterized membrane protein
MDTKTIVAIVIAVVVVLIAVFVFALERKRRSQRLKEHFGPEYDQLVKEQGDPRRAEAVLADREKRVEKLSIRELSREDRLIYAEEWANVQKRFVDDPAIAVNEADSLVTAVMTKRGYPMATFEQRSADISVHYPRVVQNYRAARLISARHAKGQATTEELRQALVHYRSLFDELLETPKSESTGVPHGRIASYR